MDRLIDWQLYSNNELIVDLKDIHSSYKKDESLVFLDGDEKNIIDLVHNEYKRITKDYEMIVDFNNKICYFKLPNMEELSIQIDGEMIVEKNKIIIKYNYDEEKIIIVEIKE